MIVKLRTLTEKSTLGFGRHGDIIISELLKTQKSYLAWVYYNCSNITFCDSVLDIVLPHDDLRIKKPGKNPDSYNRNLVWSQTTFSAFKYNAHMERQSKIAKAQYRKGRENKWFNKGGNAWKNQGHK